MRNYFLITVVSLFVFVIGCNSGGGDTLVSQCKDATNNYYDEGCSNHTPEGTPFTRENSLAWCGLLELWDCSECTDEVESHFDCMKTMVIPGDLCSTCDSWDDLASGCMDLYCPL